MVAPILLIGLAALAVIGIVKDFKKDQARKMPADIDSKK